LVTGLKGTQSGKPNMTILIGLLVGLAGMALLIIGLGFFVAFRFALRHFDQALNAELASQGRDQVERAAMKIQNPMVRRFVLKHLVGTGGTIAVSVVRGALESRKRTGLYMALAGAVALIGSLFTSRWLPLIWPAV
jgi:CBS domain containing-hemolysin-like protein